MDKRVQCDRNFAMWNTEKVCCNETKGRETMLGRNPPLSSRSGRKPGGDTALFCLLRPVISADKKIRLANVTKLVFKVPAAPRYFPPTQCIIYCSHAGIVKL